MRSTREMDRNDISRILDDAAPKIKGGRLVARIFCNDMCEAPVSMTDFRYWAADLWIGHYGKRRQQRLLLVGIGGPMSPFGHPSGNMTSGTGTTPAKVYPEALTAIGWLDKLGIGDAEVSQLADTERAARDAEEAEFEAWDREFAAA